MKEIKVKDNGFEVFIRGCIKPIKLELEDYIMDFVS